MVLTLFSLLEVGLLLVNAIAVLNKERFLTPIGLTTIENFTEFRQPQSSIKRQIINFIYAIQTVMRIPLIGINILVIILKLALG